MILKVVKYGDPVLEKEGQPVTEFDGKLNELVENMFEPMLAEKGVGLAAPQIGQSLKLFVMDCSGGKELKDRIAFINPTINETKETQVGEEGCLSFPDIYFQVERPRIVTVTAFDVNGKEFTMDVEDLAARCVLHETDHLYGKLFTDFLKKLSFLKRDKIKKKIDKKVKYGEWD